ncbi:uncharacterized protein BO66DRAFT_153159 [Aspergillus aculeatinus CBS 121060]|uniref:Uncharacterized protein n=1 Tax=Aspergillus aculeatinus CBS 121060 TaxID=1448322 RepID=A0ACD1H197_9EURO|nr:hypothetical protein BO66DRAFT_153159 [Aspergillus aculeatinus CBS 121060]RAH67532.1 hypothetical protein BO66DRAFT_153159 [Aspergillus aculeatinus CBS 121060]
MDYSGLVVSSFLDQKIRYTIFGAPVLELYGMEVDYPDFSGYIITDKHIERACQALEDNGLESCQHGADCPTMTGHEQPPTDIPHFHFPREATRIVVSNRRESSTTSDSTDSSSSTGSSASGDDEPYQPMLTVRIYRKSVYMWQARDPPLRRPRAVHVDYMLSGEGENRLQDIGRNDVILPSFACWAETLFLNLCRDLIGGSVLQELWKRELEKVALSIQDNNYLDIEPPFGELLWSFRENLRLQQDTLTVGARRTLRKVYEELRLTGEMPETQGVLYSELGLEPPELEEGSEDGDGDGDRTPTAQRSYDSDEGSGETLATESRSSDSSESRTAAGSSDQRGSNEGGSSEASSSEASSSEASSSEASSSEASSSEASSSESSSSQSTSDEDD